MNTSIGRGLLLGRQRAPVVFGLALVVLVALGAVTQSSIAELVSATGSVTRSVQVLERLQALKAVVREVESSQLGLLLTDRAEYRESYQDAQAEMLRVRRDLQDLLDTPRGREHLQALGARTTELATFFNKALIDRQSRRQAGESALPPASPDEEISDRVLAAIGAIEQEQRQAIGESRAVLATRARTARWHVLAASALTFMTILIAALMVRRDVLERQKATDRLERANATLAEAVAEAERRGEDITRLARLSHFLQGCRSTEEACLVIEKTAPALFGAAGALYLASGDRLERTIAWDHGRELQQAFSHEACWAMRQGTLHETSHQSTTPGCLHLDNVPHATCVPLLADGSAFGLVVLTARESGADRAHARTALLAAIEQISAGLGGLRLRESLRIQSLHDPLTGLYNRRFLHDALSRECHDARRHPERPLALMLLDVDHFKRVNDTSGHAAGDALLQALAELLGRTFRGSDIACRFGGEEFAVVLAETPLDVALRRAEALRLAVHALQAHHGSAVLEGLTVSIGVTAGAGVGLTPEVLLHEADVALYAAKARGRDCCEAYTAAPSARPLPFEIPPVVPLA